MLWTKPGTNASDVIIIHVEDEKITVNEVEYTLAYLQSGNDFRPFSNFVFPLKSLVSNQRTMTDDNGGNHFYPPTQTPFELYAYTNISKLGTDALSRQIVSNLNVNLIFYPETKNFKDALLIVHTPADENTPYKITTTNVKGEIVTYIPDKVLPVGLFGSIFLPKCTLEYPTTNVDQKGIDISFIYRDVNGEKVECDFEATAKCDMGYLSHTKFDVVKGMGSFKFMPLGLNSGEQPKVQIGIGKYTDIVNVTLTVV